MSRHKCNRIIGLGR